MVCINTHKFVRMLNGMCNYTQKTHIQKKCNLGKTLEIILLKKFLERLAKSSSFKNIDFSFCGNCAKTLEFHGVAPFFYFLSTVAMSIIIVLLRFVNCYVHRPR